MAVGIFDSGLGGLTVYREIRKLMPDLALVYYGDNARIPYGVRDSDDIYNLTCQGTQRLFDAGCDLVILACNTASAAALRRMQEGWIPDGKRVLGVFVPLIEIPRQLIVNVRRAGWHCQRGKLEGHDWTAIAGQACQTRNEP